ncbi:restriction endonuclease [Streptomyces sp. NPDC053431]|uniref:restriction endonuclease n=1 Tax=Streptomyces sp. NPDC053431 TaxID=3365703 RepID=UPI0037D66F2C
MARQRAAQWERVRSQGLRYALTQLDAKHHRQFKHAVRDLMRRDGCAAAMQSGGARDNGADLKATDPYGRRWVIQCKHRRAELSGYAVGTPDCRSSTAPADRYTRAMSSCSPPADGSPSRNGRLRPVQWLHLVDRAVLGDWASGSRPLWQLLRAVPPLRHPSA